MAASSKSTVYFPVTLTTLSKSACHWSVDAPCIIVTAFLSNDDDSSKPGSDLYRVCKDLESGFHRWQQGKVVTEVSVKDWMESEQSGLPAWMEEVYPQHSFEVIPLDVAGHNAANDFMQAGKGPRGEKLTDGSKGEGDA